MHTLYDSPGSANLVAHLALAKLGVPYALNPVDLEAGGPRTPAYRALNPLGVMLTPIVDGQPHGEAAALTPLLTERRADAALAPASGSAARTGFRRWMSYLADTLQPAFRRWFCPGARRLRAAPEGASGVAAGLRRTRAGRVGLSQ